MAWIFGDSFDPYAATVDMGAGYWDSVTTNVNFVFVAGRFGGQAVQLPSTTGTFTKSSGINDAVHHFNVAFRQTTALSGTAGGITLQLLDGVTGQCAVVFRSDGVILLASGSGAGATLATYSGAVTAASTWFAFEFEIVINNTAGRFRVRKNGNTVDDFDSGAVLNTRVSANNYANKLTVVAATNTPTGQLDDLLWRSDASSVPWVGDIRAYTRMPASDAAAVFSRSTGATNFSCVDETLQNGTTDYVFSANVNDADFYNIAALASTPATVVAVTTRGFMQKSDAGTRGAAVQLNSGATTVTSTPTLLSSSFGWLWRTDLVDPNTSTAWTAAAVNNVQIGPKVTS